MLNYEETLKYLFLAPGMAIFNTFTENTVTKYSVEEKIEILQKNLYSIRKLSGIKASDFAKKLYVSKQALNNWETDKNKKTINLAQYGMLLTVLPTIGLSNPSLRCSTKTFATILFIIFFPEYFTKKDFSNYQEIIAMLGNLTNKSHQSFFNSLIQELPSNPPFDMKEKFEQQEEAEAPVTLETIEGSDIDLNVCLQNERGHAKLLIPDQLLCEYIDGIVVSKAGKYSYVELSDSERIKIAYELKEKWHVKDAQISRVLYREEK